MLGENKDDLFEFGFVIEPGSVSTLTSTFSSYFPIFSDVLSSMLSEASIGF